MEGGRRRLATGVVVLVVAAALVGPVVATGLVLADGDADRGHGNDCDGADGDNPGAADGVNVDGVENREVRAAEPGTLLTHAGCDDARDGDATAEEPSVATQTAGANPTPTEPQPATPTHTATPTDRPGQGGGQSSSSTQTPAPTPTATDGTTQPSDDQPATPTETRPQPTAPPSVPPGAAPGRGEPGLGGDAPPLPMVEAVPGVVAPADTQPSMGEVATYSVVSAGIVGLATGLGWLFVRP